MLKVEFEKLVNEKVTAEDYEKIERVYTDYPGIDEIKGKEQIASMFLISRMVLINDLYPRALKISQYKTEIEKLQKELFFLINNRSK